MNVRYAVLMTLGLSLNIQAQETHTLEHIAPENATETPNYWGQTNQGVALWGYYIGHNIFGDEAVGEKYEIDGSGQVVGVIAYLGGTSTSDDMASYKVHAVATDGLPGAELGSADFPMGSAPTDGATPHLMMFNDGVPVNDEFFVILDLGDYSHDPLQGDTICLMSGADGSRPATDAVFGRNVIRWHDHDGPIWKDFLTQNFTPISTYFAIYPVMSGPVNVASLGSLDLSTTFHPMPFADELYITLTAVESTPIDLHLFSSDGRLLRTERHPIAQGEQRLRLDTADLPPGSYVIALEQGVQRYAQMITK